MLIAHGYSVRLAHVAATAARSLARAAEAVTRVSPSRQPLLTRYAVDQIASSVVLDLTKAAEQGWQPRHRLDGFLTGVSGRGRSADSAGRLG